MAWYELKIEASYRFAKVSLDSKLLGFFFFLLSWVIYLDIYHFFS